MDQHQRPDPMGPGSPRASARRPEPDPMGEPWWSRAVFYQVYPRSFADSNGDGVGDLDGLASRLDHLQQLGVDAIWINPVTVSPMADHGYDVADPRDIDPLFGGMPAFERLVAAAHRQGSRIRRGNARDAPNAVAMAAGCRFPGRATFPRSGSRRVQTPGCRCRRNGRR